MRLRPQPARWFELLAARDDLAPVLELLARTGAVQLESHAGSHRALELTDLHRPLEAIEQLTRRFTAYWPAPRALPARCSPDPEQVLAQALTALEGWRQAAEPLVCRLEADANQTEELALLARLLRALGPSPVDLGGLGDPGGGLAGRAYLLPATAHLPEIPADLLHLRTADADYRYLLVLGPQGSVQALDPQIQAHKGRRLAIPGWLLPGALTDNLNRIEEHLAAVQRETEGLRAELADLNGRHGIAELLGEVARTRWFIAHAARLPVTWRFVWVTGWSAERDPDRLNRQLALAGLRAMLHYPPAPAGLKPPMVLENPWWARPFELFLKALGTPGLDEPDPSRLLAVIAPLLFGYMFGDVGQGAVLLTAGLLLRRRWPAMDLLVAGGASAMLFGLLFGSLFALEHLIPPLWLHPLASPLTLLAVPLLGGIALIVLGILLSGSAAAWRGTLEQWLAVELGVLWIYLGLLLALLHDAGRWLALAGVLWYLAGSFRYHGGLRALPLALGHLAETLFQLGVNTLSFTRVGAFALAHAGLSLAVVSLMEGVASPVGQSVVLLAGNLLILALEGLVVAIQTSRLILFEFFIRFVRAEGRVFRPLELPPC